MRIINYNKRIRDYLLKLCINYRSIWKSLNDHRISYSVQTYLKIEKYFQNDIRIPISNIWNIIFFFLTTRTQQIKLYKYSNRVASLLREFNVIQCYPTAILRIILYEVRPIAIMLVEMVDELFTKEPAIPSTKYDGCLRITRDCA